jgi:hypothetical protein
MWMKTRNNSLYSASTIDDNDDIFPLYMYIKILMDNMSKFPTIISVSVVICLFLMDLWLEANVIYRFFFLSITFPVSHFVMLFQILIIVHQPTVIALAIWFTNFIIFVFRDTRLYTGRVTVARWMLLCYWLKLVLTHRSRTRYEITVTEIYLHVSYCIF